MASEIIFEVVGKVGLITLNRSERLNAFTKTMAYELIETFDQVNNDDAIRSVVVTGAGRGFCAGADLVGGGKTFDYSKDEARSNGKTRDTGGKVSLAIFQSKKPIVGAINGPAVGIGVTMTLPMDLRIASTKAKFGFVFTRRGVIPEAASSWFLPRIVGISQALDWVLSGRVFDAQEALAGNLVSEVIEPDLLIDRALERANQMTLGTSPVSVALARQMLWTMMGAGSPMDAHRLDSKAMVSRGRSGDAYEGIESFLQKREPNFMDLVSVDVPDLIPKLDEF
ncbi:crotonase/enoyl-CoA hydratase family protein [Acidithrix sp. C25]|uniref:crotonase/enoyl-CoA hydratase family protein n=1 Tax=Acidithrix sp. C25 TaxID=1671482 RepID=UPI00191B9472|nr:crotonase/enoyl-CoA hydratase family protein [Acidithrix sp. C25]